MGQYAKLTVKITKADKNFAGKVGDIREINKNFKESCPAVGDVVALGAKYGKNTKNMGADAVVVSVDGTGTF